jgi:hypothetical protein
MAEIKPGDTVILHEPRSPFNGDLFIVACILQNCGIVTLTHNMGTWVGSITTYLEKLEKVES